MRTSTNSSRCKPWNGMPRHVDDSKTNTGETPRGITHDAGGFRDSTSRCNLREMSSAVTYAEKPEADGVMPCTCALHAHVRPTERPWYRESSRFTRDSSDPLFPSSSARAVFQRPRTDLKHLLARTLVHRDGHARRTRSRGRSHRLVYRAFDAVRVHR